MIRRLCWTAVFILATAHRLDAALPCTWGGSGAPPSNIVFSATYSAFTGGSVWMNSSFVIDCKAPSPTATVALTRGNNSSTYTARRMAYTMSNGSVDYMTYNLYNSNGATKAVWGDTSEGTITNSYDPHGRDRLFPDTIYGLMDGATDPAAGLHTDVVIARMTYSGGSENSSIAIQVNVIPECQVTSGFNLDFGTYDPLAAGDRTGSATLSVTCTKDALVNVGLDNGQNPAGAWRGMKNSLYGDVLQYQLYTTSGMATTWPNDPTTNPSARSASRFTALAFTVFGKIPKAQDVSVGPYLDTIRASVNY